MKHLNQLKGSVPLSCKCVGITELDFILFKMGNYFYVEVDERNGWDMKLWWRPCKYFKLERRVRWVCGKLTFMCLFELYNLTGLHSSTDFPLITRPSAYAFGFSFSPFSLYFDKIFCLCPPSNNAKTTVSFSLNIFYTLYSFYLTNFPLSCDK